jgi:hypothetical protein
MKFTALPCAALLSLALVGASRADQLAYTEKAVAEKAAARLAPGTLYLDWVSHMGGAPRLMRIKSVEVKFTNYENYYELVADVEQLAVSQKGGQQGASFDFRLERSSGRVSLDLAYVYVPSSEIKSMFVCLGKVLEQPCEVESIAVEVPPQVLAEVAGGSGGIAGSLDGASPRQVWRIGQIKKRGDALVLKNSRRVLELSSFAASEVERALHERVGARVSLRGTLSADGRSLQDVEVIKYHSR